MDTNLAKRLKRLEAWEQAEGTAEIWRLNEDGTYTRGDVALSAEGFEERVKRRPATTFIIDDIPKSEPSLMNKH